MGPIEARAQGSGDPRVADCTREMGVVLRERAALVDPAKVEYAVNDRSAEWDFYAGTGNPDMATRFRTRGTTTRGWV